jgi:hypothetical protein
MREKTQDHTSHNGTALQGKSYLCIPFLGIARPQSQNDIHVSVSDLYIPRIGRSTYFLLQNKQIDCGNKYINRSQTHECGNLDCGRAIPFLGILVSNFWHWFFEVWSVKIRMFETWVTSFSHKWSFT